MKKAIKSISIFLIIMFICALSVSAASKPTVNIKRGSAVIDGKIDDIWQYAEDMPLDRVNPAIEGGVMTEARVYAKMLWDDEYLYILMVANDNTKFNTEGPLSQEDCFEVFFSLENVRTESYSEKNQFRFLYDLLTPLESGMRNLDNISPDPLQYIEIAGSDVPTGYIMEVKISAKIGINFSLKENMIIGIDFGYDDNADQGEARSTQLCWNTDGANVAAVPNAMGTIKLVNEDAIPPVVVEEVVNESPAEVSGEPAAPVVTPTAPQTSDAPVIAIFAVLLISGLGVIISAKSKKTRV